MRYTAKTSIRALQQKWMAVNPDDPKLNAIGRVLANAARTDLKHFEQVCRELRPENGSRG